jgi:PTH1 family peptidyl-tRNA hydrolase
MIKLAAFLGNPGKKYERNRHNAGRMLAQALPFYSSLSWQKKFKGFSSSNGNVQFVMPETYMNLSGESVFAAASFYKMDIKEIIVVHDELELPLGTISLKFAGGLGGHNGLRSMNKCFGGPDFWRLRIGIGRPGTRLPGEGGNADSLRTTGSAAYEADLTGEANPSVHDWVLSDFTNDEKEILNPALDAGAGLLIKTFTEEPDTLLNDWKKKKIIMPGPQKENEP